MRTPLTYYGGKQKLAAQIVPWIPAHRVYLEPFAGGAAVLFAKPRADRETINDSDGRVVAFWRTLRDRPDELARAIELTPYSRAEWQDCHRNETPADDVEIARRFLVDIDQSYARTGENWSPPSVLLDRRGRWQPGVWENLPSKLVAAATRLRGIALEHGDGCKLIERFDQAGAVIYCDPPYPVATRLEPNKGYHHDDDGELWPRLLEVLAGVRHAAVILSGYHPYEPADALGWRRVELHARRHAQAGLGRSPDVAPEALWLSPAVPDRIPTLLEGTL